MLGNRVRPPLGSLSATPILSHNSGRLLRSLGVNDEAKCEIRENFHPRAGLHGQLQLPAGAEVGSGDLKSESLSGQFVDLSPDSVSMIRTALLQSEEVLFGFDGPTLDGWESYRGKLWKILNLSPIGAFEAKAWRA